MVVCCYVALHCVSKNTNFGKLLCWQAWTNFDHFYHATRMHSADYVVARCLSVTCWCIESKRLHITSKFFHRSSFTIVVFPYQTVLQYSDADPPNEGVKCKGVWKNHDFPPISHFILQMMPDRAIVTMEGKWNRTQAFKWYRFEWSWVASDPDFKVTILFNIE